MKLKGKHCFPSSDRRNLQHIRWGWHWARLTSPTHQGEDLWYSVGYLGYNYYYTTHDENVNPNCKYEISHPFTSLSSEKLIWQINLNNLFGCLMVECRIDYYFVITSSTISLAQSHCVRYSNFSCHIWWILINLCFWRAAFVIIIKCDWQVSLWIPSKSSSMAVQRSNRFIFQEC